MQKKKKKIWLYIHRSWMNLRRITVQTVDRARIVRGKSSTLWRLASPIGSSSLNNPRKIPHKYIEQDHANLPRGLTGTCTIIPVVYLACCSSVLGCRRASLPSSLDQHSALSKSIVPLFFFDFSFTYVMCLWFFANSSSPTGCVLFALLYYKCPFFSTSSYFFFLTRSRPCPDHTSR